MVGISHGDPSVETIRVCLRANSFAGLFLIRLAAPKDTKNSVEAGPFLFAFPGGSAGSPAAEFGFLAGASRAATVGRAPGVAALVLVIFGCLVAAEKMRDSQDAGDSASAAFRRAARNIR